MEQLIFSICGNHTTRDAQTSTISHVNLNHLPCSACGSTHPKLGAGKGPHSASLKCAQCDHFIKWIGKSELAKIENQGGQV
jgi:hypothetical protein